MPAEIHVGDVGTVFEYLILDENSRVTNLTGGVLSLVFSKPDRSTKVVTPTMPNGGVDGLVSYTTVNGDLDQAGDWRAQVYVTLGSDNWHTDIGVFRVHANLT